MELPDYLLNTARKRRYLLALGRIPAVIAQMAEYEGICLRDYLLSIRMYTLGGLQLSLDHFWIEKKELLEHVEQAITQGCKVQVQGKTITIQKKLPDGKYVIALYEPTEK